MLWSGWAVRTTEVSPPWTPADVGAAHQETACRTLRAGVRAGRATGVQQMSGGLGARPWLLAQRQQQPSTGRPSSHSRTSWWSTW